MRCTDTMINGWYLSHNRLVERVCVMQLQALGFHIFTRCLRFDARPSLCSFGDARADLVAQIVIYHIFGIAPPGYSPFLKGETNNEYLTVRLPWVSFFLRFGVSHLNFRLRHWSHSNKKSYTFALPLRDTNCYLIEVEADCRNIFHWHTNNTLFWTYAISRIFSVLGCFVYRP